MGRKFKTLDNLKNELLQNQKHQQQQPVISDLKEIKDNLNDFEKHRRRNNLKIDEVIEEEKESWSQSEKKMQEIIKTSYSLSETLKLNVHTVVEKQW